MKSLCFISSLLFLSSCSVSTAISGRTSPDLSSIRVGAAYNEINASLGKPAKVTVTSNGERLCVYKYEKASDPSLKNVVANSLMDVSTLGMWELVRPVNNSIAHVTVTYDKENKVASINPYVTTN